ncbi:uncharacterized protein N7479_002816 [Penicillium vulpinum]|uniref:Uncharacterized protein n=1 Tax=Penicillium vulpinum TaxID=29845 RepID=A0A1V6RT98_9EURO|nr:uncharacterized protein N7479_002816 [Penicillium vulpinum]KAJ5972898.1 hypothetical protein N7479_002816 [Penicillium vulpinum]OQE04770.1 hypothetical protein PENVUL_c030G05387 [Penicillium vulpinum]
MTSTIRAKQIVESPLPSLQIRPYHTVSSALQRMSFVGTLIPWSNFLRSVESVHKNQNWARPRTSPYTNGPHTTEPDRVHIGDEHGLQGRFQQAIGQAFGAVLEAKSINLYFADFKSSGSNYENIPDVVGLQDVGGSTNIKLVGELKTPWVFNHDLHTAIRRLRDLRQKIAQPVRDMQSLGCEYGFISTYNYTIFLRQFQSPSGDWEVWYSPPISSSSYYTPTVPNPQSTHLALPQVSMKQCMFYVCTLASAANPVNNQTVPWVVDLS